ncbi:hypothetical protein SVIOM74S_06160 [Streptomyces violarus]
MHTIGTTYLPSIPYDPAGDARPAGLLKLPPTVKPVYSNPAPTNQCPSCLRGLAVATAAATAFELTPHDLARAPRLRRPTCPPTPRPATDPAPALAGLMDVLPRQHRHAVTAVVHLDPYATVLVVRHQPQQEPTAGRHAVHQRVRRQFAHTEQHVVRPARTRPSPGARRVRTRVRPGRTGAPGGRTARVGTEVGTEVEFRHSRDDGHTPWPSRNRARTRTAMLYVRATVPVRARVGSSPP